MIEIKSENGKATGKINGDTKDILVDLTIIIDAVIDKIHLDVNKTKEELLKDIFNATKSLYKNDNNY